MLGTKHYDQVGKKESYRRRMHRRRQQDHEDTNETLPLTTTTTSPLLDSADKNPRGCGNCRKLWQGRILALSRIQKVLLVVSLTAFAVWFIRQLFYWIPRIERPLEGHPYWRALIFNPWRYMYAKYWDPVRPTALRRFVMTRETAFVVNLDRSVERWTQFQRVNGDDDNEEEPPMQRFPAHEWRKADDNPAHDDGHIQLQQHWENRYPFLKLSAAKGNYGDAGCSLSHLLLWQEKLVDGDQDYIFVLEDDVEILEPLKRRTKIDGSSGTHYVIDAPNDADIVFLAQTALKRVNVSWAGSQHEPAVRLLGGFGTLGYIITREGAQKMMDRLGSSRHPLDITFFAEPSMRIYLPASGQWPAVLHFHTPSTRLGLNENN